MTIRAVGPGDVDGLARLYDGLDLEDRQRRFFCAYRPARPFFEKMAHTAEHGGFGLVAVLNQTGSEDDEIVGEADYVLLPDGDGELAVTVAKRWRGWLGPYLLDGLLEAAAARGVANLQAEVLVSNQPMLALLRSRGYATMEHPDWTVVRVVIGSTGRVPSWPGPHDRPRVLVEVPGGRWHGEDAARTAGLQVLACSGPTGRRSTCPAQRGESCPLAAGADAIVVSHPPDDEAWRDLPDAHHRLHPTVPLCLEFMPIATASPTSTPVPDGTSADTVAFVGNVARAHAERES